MFRRAIIGSFCALAVLFAAAPASAVHNHPSSASSFSVNLVRAFEPCTAGTANTDHGDPALHDASCTPPVPLNDGSSDAWQFASNGKSWVRYRTTKGDVTIDASGSGIIDGSASSANGPGTMEMIFSWTDHGCVAPDFITDCTNVDLPLLVSFNLVNGKFRVKTTANAVFGTFFGTTLPHWKSGSSIEIKNVRILDETNETFAVPGLYIR